MENLGRILFIVGVVVAIAMGLGLQQDWLPWALAVLGGIVGFLNVSGAERRTFLIAGIALTVAAGAFGSVPHIGDEIMRIMSALKSFLAGALFVVAIVALFQTARD